MPEASDTERKDHRLALLRVFEDRLPTHIDPTGYLKACGEVLALLFVVSWTVSLLFAPDQVTGNPLNERLGYYSLCVGFDAWPANRVGLAVYVFAAYLGIRFVWTDTMRIELSRDSLTPWQYWSTNFTNLAYAASLCLFALVFLESPFHDHYLHTLIFIQLIVFRFLVVASKFREAEVVTDGSKVFLAVYGVVSFGAPVLFMTAFVTYDRTGVVVVPWPITAAFDYGWFACLALTTKFLPDAPRIRATWTLERGGRP